jgi:hypothetical protein
VNSMQEVHTPMSQLDDAALGSKYLVRVVRFRLRGPHCFYAVRFRVRSALLIPTCQNAPCLGDQHWTYPFITPWHVQYRYQLYPLMRPYFFFGKASPYFCFSRGGNDAVVRFDGLLAAIFGSAPCLDHLKIPSFFTLSPSHQFLAACMEY